MSRWIPIVAAVPVVLALAACVESPEPELGTSTEALSPCPKWGCGENSPLMGPYGEHEYEWTGTQPNSEGSYVVGLFKSGVMYRPRVIGAQLIAEAADGTLLFGAALQGSHFLIRTPTGEYKIFIMKVTPRASSNVRFWVGAPTQLETYELRYLKVSRIATHPEPLCRNPPERDAGEGTPTRMWHAPLEAILYTGDRYDADRKEVIASSYAASGTHFNIACAGSALAKLVLTRHATVGVSSTHPSTADERQTMLKVYTCDVCGDGQSWTEQGTKLHWQNTKHWSDFTGTEFAQEALWGPDGAKCLSTHRLGSTWKASLELACPNIALNNPCPFVPPGGALPMGAYAATAVPIDPDLP